MRVRHGLLSLLSTLLALAGCGPRGPESLAGATMGTTYHVTLAAIPASASRAQAQAAIDSVLDDVNRQLSTYREDSAISRFNADTRGEWVPVSATFFAVMAAAREASDESGGAFDVTVAPLVDAWGFGAGQANSPVPDPAQLARLRARVGYRKLEIRSAPPALRKLEPTLRLDVAGIAPGYAVDEIVRRLRALRIAAGIVELGGEVRAWGRSPEQRPWRVAVEVPVAGDRRPYTLVDLDDTSISTSGDYRDFREIGRRRVSHTIDPRSGQPVAHDLASVTVLHRSAMMADAYATALMVLGPEEGYSFAVRHHLAAMFIERTGVAGQWRERVTPGFTPLRHPVH